MIIKNGTIDSQLPRDYVARVGLFADVHVGYPSWGDYSTLKTIVENMNKKKPDFCFVLGDAVDSGYNRTPDLKAEQVAILNECFSKLKSPLFRLKGNHDAEVAEFTEFGVVTFNGIRFISIFPKYAGLPVPEGATANAWSAGMLTDADISWIADALADGEGYRNIILSHYAIANGDGFIWGICDSTTALSGATIDGHRDDLLALTTQYGVDLFLNGHEHANGLVNAKVDNTDMTNVQIPSAVARYVVLTIYEDRYELVEYDCVTDAEKTTLTIPFA